MDQIAPAFAKRFRHWDITIPPENLESRTAGHLSKGGWLIQFCFGIDDGGNYLDYYAAHRMTDDQHIRLYSDGKSLELEALHGMYATSDDHQESERSKERYVESNRRIAKALAEKGFTLFTMNMYLRAGLSDREKT